MNKHTPGPWKSVEVGDTGGENPMPVYEVQTVDGHKTICEYIRPDDARLCAAAPELLESLQAILDTFIQHHNHPEHVAARMAIRKATGE